MISLRVTDLSKCYSNREVLKDVSFSISSGSITGIVGANGAGKSTLLRCIAGLEVFDKGSIELEGLLLGANSSGHSDRKMYRHVGMVFQQNNLWPHKTALENVTLAPIIACGRQPAEVTRSARSLFDKLGLLEKASLLARHLSGGEQQRVALARAIVLKPSILLLDEATSAIDKAYTEEILQILRTMASGDGMTLLLVSHKLEFLRKAADSLLTIEEGRISHQPQI